MGCDRVCMGNADGLVVSMRTCMGVHCNSWFNAFSHCLATHACPGDTDIKQPVVLHQMCLSTHQIGFHQNRLDFDLSIMVKV